MGNAGLRGDAIITALRMRTAYAEGRNEGIYFSYAKRDKQGTVDDALKPIETLQSELMEIEKTLSKQDYASDKLKTEGERFGRSFMLRVQNSLDQADQIITLYEGMPPDFRTTGQILFYHRYASAGHAYGLLYAIEECQGERKCIAEALRETER